MKKIKRPHILIAALLLLFTITLSAQPIDGFIENERYLEPESFFFKNLTKEDTFTAEVIGYAKNTDGTWTKEIKQRKTMPPGQGASFITKNIKVSSVKLYDSQGQLFATISEWGSWINKNPSYYKDNALSLWAPWDPPTPYIKIQETFPF